MAHRYIKFIYKREHISPETPCIGVKVNVMVALLLAQRESRGIALLILNLSTRFGWVLNASIQLVLPIGETFVTHCRGE